MTGCFGAFASVSAGAYVFLALLAVSVVAALVIRNRIRRFSRSLFGTDSLAEGLSRQADVAAETPRSVTGMTRLMEPQIVRDFPEFVWEEFRQRAESALISALAAVTAEDAGLVSEKSEELRQQLDNRIRDNQAAGVSEHFDGVRIHQTEIADYRKGGGRCVVTIQSAVEYYYCRMKDGQILSGSKERRRQTRYNTELVYIQDAEISGSAVGTACPYCGAPVRTLGRFVCEYCGAEVVPVNRKVWSFQRIYEVDYRNV